MWLWTPLALAAGPSSTCQSAFETEWPEAVRASILEGQPGGRQAAVDALRDDPDDALRWVALSLTSLSLAERRWALSEASWRAPRHPAVVLGQARFALDEDRTNEAVRALRLVRDDPTVAFGAASIAAADDTQALRALNARCPDRADVALRLARKLEPAAALEVLLPTGPPAVLDLRARLALEADRPEVAADAVSQLGDDVDPQLRRWLACLDAGTVTTPQIRAQWRAQRSGLVTQQLPTGGPPQAPAPEATECAAAWVYQAERPATSSSDRIAALQKAMELAPDDDLRLRLGLAWIAADAPEQSLVWLEGDRTPVRRARAEAYVAMGRDARARRELKADPGPGTDWVAWTRTKAAAAPTDVARLEVLVEGVDRTWDPELLNDARALADQLSVVPERLAAVSAIVDIGPVDAEMVVVAEGSRALKERVARQLSDLGYNDPKVRGGSVKFTGKGLDRPTVTLFDDGNFTVRAETASYDPSSAQAGLTSPRQRRAAEARLLEKIRDDVTAWQRAVQEERTLRELGARLARQLDVIWQSEKSGADRRSQLIGLWRERECNRVGDEARTQIERFMRWRVMGSPDPFTPDEIDAVNADPPCGRPLELR